MNRQKKRFESFGIYAKMLWTFIVVMSMAMILVTLLITYFSRKFISELMENNSELIMQEISYQLDNIYDSVNQMYNNYNSWGLYQMFEKNPEFSNFEQVKQELEYVSQIKEVILANNMHNMVSGVLLFLDRNRYQYVGSGSFLDTYDITGAPWYRQFAEEGGSRLIYGPSVEEYKYYYKEDEKVMLYIRSWKVPSAARAGTS